VAATGTATTAGSSGSAAGSGGADAAGVGGAGDATSASTGTASVAGSGGSTSGGMGGSGGAGGSGGTPVPVKVANAKSTAFDGKDDHLTVGNVLGFEVSAPFSAFAWTKTIANKDQFVIGKRLMSGNKTGWQLAFGAGSPPTVEIDFTSKGNSWLELSAPAANLFDGKWHHVGFSYDGSATANGCVIYVDGQALTKKVLQQSLNGSIENMAPFTIGAREGIGVFFEGNIDEVTVFGSALTSTDVSEMLKTAPIDPKSMSAAGSLQAWWRMGDGDTAPKVSDHSGKGLFATMVNGGANAFVNDAAP
jgi:hypothetical protein